MPEKCVRIVQDMYEGAITQVKSSVGLTDKIPVRVGLHQGSSPIPYLFAMFMDVSACMIKDLSPWCMLYVDVIVWCGTRREEAKKKLEEWRRAMEDRGMKINIERKCLPEVQWRWELGWKLRYQSTFRTFGKIEYI